MTFDALQRVPSDVGVELLCKAHLGVWAERKLGLTNAPVHWEWTELAMSHSRLCVVAPRDHAKSAVFSVNQACWRCQYNPGFWAHIICDSLDQAKSLKGRVDVAMDQSAPWMLQPHRVDNDSESVYANWSRITVGSAGKRGRGLHPDLIVGDDVLEEESCMSSRQRKKTERWWFGTVAGMAHGWTHRTIGEGRRQLQVQVPPTIMHLVGTPFHRDDLLLSMRSNSVYTFRRYAAEYDPTRLVDGLAVEATMHAAAGVVPPEAAVVS